jgi:N-methylhydantoinase A
VRPLDAIGDDELTTAFAELEQRGLAILSGQGADPASVVSERFVEACYSGQTWETLTKAPLGRYGPAERAELGAEFHRTHERLWAFRADDLPIVILNVRVSLVAARPKPPLARLAAGTGTPAPESLLFEREVHLNGAHRALPFFDRDTLRAGDRVQGPAAIVEVTSTTFLLDGDTCSVDTVGNLRIEKLA